MVRDTRIGVADFSRLRVSEQVETKQPARAKINQPEILQQLPMDHLRRLNREGLFFLAGCCRGKNLVALTELMKADKV